MQFAKINKLQKNKRKLYKQSDIIDNTKSNKGV